MQLKLCSLEPGNKTNYAALVNYPIMISKYHSCTLKSIFQVYVHFEDVSPLATNRCIFFAKDFLGCVVCGWGGEPSSTIPLARACIEVTLVDRGICLCTTATPIA